MTALRALRRGWCRCKKLRSLDIATQAVAGKLTLVSNNEGSSAGYVTPLIENWARK
jgi:hypothetical protein